MTNPGAIVAAMQNRHVRTFRNAGATSESTARSLDELGCWNSPIHRRLVRAGVLREVSGKRFYLDEDAWNAVVRRRRAIFLGLLAILLAFVIILVWGKF